MNLTSDRRLSRLEKLVASAVAERKQTAPEREAWLRQDARDHTRKLVTLILHGDPQIDEPLVIAWERALGCLGLSGMGEELYRLRAVLEDLPGDTENAKIAHVFSSAPSWLLHFCRAWLDCFILGIELPKSLELRPQYGRDGLREAKGAWPDLPKGTIGAGRPIPKPKPMRISSEERNELIRLHESGEENWLRRDRHRWREIMAKVDSTDPASD
jgi:hypothetical protein